MSCPICGYDVEGDQVCPLCGTPVELDVELQSLFDGPDADEDELGGES